MRTTVSERGKLHRVLTTALCEIGPNLSDYSMDMNCALLDVMLRALLDLEELATVPVHSVPGLETNERLLNTLAEIECLNIPQRGLVIGTMIGAMAGSYGAANRKPQPVAVKWALDQLDKAVATAKQKFPVEGGATP